MNSMPNLMQTLTIKRAAIAMASLLTSLKIPQPSQILSPQVPIPTPFSTPNPPNSAQGWASFLLFEGVEK